MTATDTAAVKNESSGQPNTRELILDAAEKLFAEQGIGATSIRAIIAAAEVNNASVHYHFGSKERLITEVFRRRANLIRKERLALLDAIPNDLPQLEKLEAIVHAFIRPGLFGADKSRVIAQRFAVFGARVVTENSELARALMAQEYDEPGRRFLAALTDATTGFSAHELHWRMHAMMGLLVYTMNRSNRIVSITHSAFDPNDDDAVLEELVKIAVDIFRPR
jgi:AcrR family transcriptional regulator